MRLAVVDVAGGDELTDEIPETGGAETDFGERVRGRGDDGALCGWDAGEKRAGAGKGDDVGEVFDFTAFHPAIFLEMSFGRSVGRSS